MRRETRPALPNLNPADRTPSNLRGAVFSLLLLFVLTLNLKAQLLPPDALGDGSAPR